MTGKKEIKEIQTTNASSVLHGGQEKSAAPSYIYLEMKGCCTKTMHPRSKSKGLGHENQEMGWGQFTSLWIINSLQSYYCVYIIGVKSVIWFPFYFFCVCVLTFFFFTPLEIALKSKFCAHPEQEQERERRLAFSNAFKFIRFSEGFFSQAFTLNRCCSTTMNTKEIQQRPSIMAHPR